MNSLHKIAHICIINLRRLLHDSRLILCVATIFLLIIGKRTNELRMFCSTLNVKTSPFPLFVVITETLYNQKLLLLLFLLLVCDAPFINGMMSSCIQRTGRLSWFLGTFGYMVTLALGYWVIVFIACVISILGCCEWTSEWGRVFTSIMKTGEISDLLGSLRYLKVGNALKAFTLSFSLKCLLTTLLASITWLVNAKTNKNYGVVIPIILIMFHGHICGWFVDTSWVYFSPVSLSNLSMLNIDGIARLPSVQYAFVHLIGANLLAGYLLWRTTLRFSVGTNTLVK